MAKTTNPLFSLSASGTMGGIVYRQTGDTATARVRTFRRAPAPTAAQARVRANCRAAATAWAALTQPEREEWAARGLKLRFASDRENLTTLNHGWALWLSEWNLQQASAERPPMFPT